MSSASDYVTVNGPQAPSYNAPLVGQQIGQNLANLPDAYMKGRENQRTIALQNAFPDGIPTRADGTPDTSAIMSKMAKIGGGQYIQGITPFLINADVGRSISGNLSNIDSGVNGTGPTSSSPSASGPGNVMPSQPQTKPQDQPTVMKIVAAQGIPNDQVGVVSDAISRQLGVGPSDPINPADPQIRNVLGPALQRFKTAGQVQPQAPQAPQLQQPQQAAPPQQPAQRPALDPEQPSDEEKRLAFGAARARQIATAAGVAGNQAAATAAENQAKSYDERRQQLSDARLKGAQTEYEHELSRGDPTQEQKNARDPAVSQMKLTEAQQKNDVERFGKQYETIGKIGEQADETLPQLDLAKRLVNDPSFSSGSLAPGSDMMKRVSAAIGLDPNSATPDQLFDKIRAGSILNQIKGMAGTGPVRVAEMKFIDQMIAGRENTPATLRTLLEIESRLYNRAQAVRDMAHSYNNGHLDTGFDKKVAEYKNNTPMFTKEELKDPRLIAPPVFNSPAELAKAGLKHGDPFKTADGRIKYVP